MSVFHGVRHRVVNGFQKFIEAEIDGPTGIFDKDRLIRLSVGDNSGKNLVALLRLDDARWFARDLAALVESADPAAGTPARDAEGGDDAPGA